MIGGIVREHSSQGIESLRNLFLIFCDGPRSSFSRGPVTPHSLFLQSIKFQAKGELETEKMLRKPTKQKGKVLKLANTAHRCLTTLTLDFFTLSFLRDSIPSILCFTFSESSNMDSRPRFFVAM